MRCWTLHKKLKQLVLLIYQGGQWYPFLIPLQMKPWKVANAAVKSGPMKLWKVTQCRCENWPNAVMKSGQCSCENWPNAGDFSEERAELVISLLPESSSASPLQLKAPGPWWKYSSFAWELHTYHSMVNQRIIRRMLQSQVFANPYGGSPFVPDLSSQSFSNSR